MAAIEVERIVKRFGQFTAVNGVTFNVEQGEIFGLLGPNGAGKSTLIRMLTTLLPPTSGTARVAGFDIVAQADDVRRTIGVIPQAMTSDLELTVRENLLIHAKLYGVGRDKRKRLIAELLDAVELTQWADTPVKKLSGGMRRRAEIARGLVHEPRIFFLDEPTTGLDPAARRALWDIVSDLKKAGRSVLLTTHYMEEAEILCDRIAIMDHGRILEHGTVDELVSKRFKERAVRFDATDGLDDDALAGLPAVTSVKHDDEAVLLYSTDVGATVGGLLELTNARGVEAENLGIRRATLEDVFLDLTGRALRD